MRESLKLLLRSPLLHFILGAGILFLIYTRLLPPEKEEILISRQTVSALVQARQEISREPLSDSELMDLINDYADEEVLIREAYRQGMDRNNYRVRKQLLDLMKSSLSAVIPQPTPEQLRKYYEENREDFNVPELRNFNHVFYKTDNPDRPVNLEEFRARFEAEGEVFTRSGDSYIQGNHFKHLSFEQSAVFFGRDFAQALFELPPWSWAGPLVSEQGIHYVRMGDVFESRIPDYDEIVPYLEESYRYSRNLEIQRQKTAELREKYRIVIEGGES